MIQTLRNKMLLVAAVGAAMTLSVVAAAKMSKTGGSSAGFHAKGPAGMGIDGTTSDLSVADDGTTVTVTVPLKNITTGIGLRDSHTKKYLGADSFPNAELTVARSALKLPKAGETVESDAKGKMKIHGQTKEVSFHYKAKLDGDTFNVAGTAPVNMNDFGVETPSYLGVHVKPDVTVFANFQTKDN
jgi:polyisoprenoid-binding protein YceI